ncbi:ParA family protein [Caproicibacter fermentans]
MDRLATDPYLKMQMPVLLVDSDPQGSLTISLGNPQPDQLSVTLTTVMGKVLTEEPIDPKEGILHHDEGVDLMPANIELSGMEVSLVNAMSREKILKQYLDGVKRQYDYVLLDCMPSLGMLTVNALAAADSVLIPVQAQYLPAKGLEQLLQTINKVRRQINPKLKIDGILLTMVDSRTNYTKEISALLRDTYGSKLKVFDVEIPHSVRAAEISAEGRSIFAHDPKGKVAEAYRELTKEVLKIEKQRQKHKSEQLR